MGGGGGQWAMGGEREVNALGQTCGEYKDGGGCCLSSRRRTKSCESAGSCGGMAPRGGGCKSSRNSSACLLGWLCGWVPVREHVDDSLGTFNQLLVEINLANS